MSSLSTALLEVRMSPESTANLCRSVLLSELSDSARHAYANTLAQAIHRHHGIPEITPNMPQGETPNFRIVGAHQHTHPRALDTTHPHEPTYGIPQAYIIIGGYEYDQTKAGLHQQGWINQWHAWLRTPHAPALTHPHGNAIILDNQNWNAAAQAALWILRFAYVDTWE